MQTRSSRRGNAIVIGLTLLSMLGFAALAVDVGFTETARAEMQATMDAAALGAVAELDGTVEGLERATDMAVALARLNEVLGAEVELAETDVLLGIYDRQADTFVTSSDPTLVNAVRVARLDEAVTPFLSMAAFAQGMSYSASTTAHRPWAYGSASSSSCFLPLAIPDCNVEGLDEGEFPPPLRFTFSPSPSDNVAWGDPSGNPNSAEIKAQLEGQCEQGKIEMGEPMYVNEGSHTSGLHVIRDILNDATGISPDGWPADVPGPPDRSWPTANDPGLSDVRDYAWGNVIQGPVALVDAGSCDSSGKFTSDLEITGITWAIIYDVKSGGGGKGEAKRKNIWVQLDPVNTHEIWGDYDPDATGDNVLGLGDAQLAH